ncbi:peptidoglycan-binding protein [Sungkyunkwania multivorans]|uniref:Peptidoglycan-binding protein n=1 Tax=Sungkyunkwania multivorans TaxID=1173618 RepID=A0ABW3CWK0_9FLAO
MAVLFLGSCDKGSVPSSPKSFLSPYHMDGLLKRVVSFRDDDRSKWRRFRETDTKDVVVLQTFLKDAGFMPRAALDGVFGYVTQAAVRLFQEYVRTIEGVATMKPDGIVGNGTMQHINRWKAAGTVSEWGLADSNNASSEYKDWIRLLQKAKTHYTNQPGPILKEINNFSDLGASIKVADWNFDTNDIHLVGIRREHGNRQHKRPNDDIFVLLIKGMVFKFWGSTDPSVAMANRKHEAFLVEGQHLYRFGWHKITDERKIYRALKPHDARGVLVLRDWDNDNALTTNDLLATDRFGNKRGLHVNPSINIHWSGIGSTNFSAGCQVIAGKSYINNHDSVIDCSKFASRSYKDLSDAGKKTKGAYNILTDLILCYAKAGVQHLYYTLGREESLDLDASFGSGHAKKTLERMQ